MCSRFIRLASLLYASTVKYFTAGRGDRRENAEKDEILYLLSFSSAFLFFLCVVV